jgi:hypothetical protein
VRETYTLSGRVSQQNSAIAAKNCEGSTSAEIDAFPAFMLSKNDTTNSFSADSSP